MFVITVYIYFHLQFFMLELVLVICQNFSGILCYFNLYCQIFFLIIISLYCPLTFSLLQKKAEQSPFLMLSGCYGVGGHLNLPLSVCLSQNVVPCMFQNYLTYNHETSHKCFQTCTVLAMIS